MNTIAIIQARLNSTRLPGKVLMDLHGQPILQHVIDRAKEAQSVDGVVVATCWPGGGAIKGYCMDWNIPCTIYDDEVDVLHRLARAAEDYGAELIVRVCANSPLICPTCIDALVAAAKKHGADYTGYRIQKGVPAIAVPTGRFAEVITAEALHRADQEMDRNDPMREHVTAVMMTNEDRYFAHYLPMPKWYKGTDLKHAAIGTAEDLDRVSEWMAKQEVTA